MSRKWLLRRWRKLRPHELSQVSFFGKKRSQNRQSCSDKVRNCQSCSLDKVCMSSWWSCRNHWIWREMVSRCWERFWYQSGKAEDDPAPVVSGRGDDGGMSIATSSSLFISTAGEQVVFLTHWCPWSSYPSWEMEPLSMASEGLETQISDSLLRSRPKWQNMVVRSIQ